MMLDKIISMKDNKDYGKLVKYIWGLSVVSGVLLFVPIFNIGVPFIGMLIFLLYVYLGYKLGKLGNSYEQVAKIAFKVYLIGGGVQTLLHILAVVTFGYSFSASLMAGMLLGGIGIIALIISYLVGFVVAAILSVIGRFLFSVLKG